MSIVSQCNEVYNLLKSGLSEAVYHDVLCCALRSQGYVCEQEYILPIVIHGVQSGRYLKPDIVVNGDTIIELKAVNSISQEHKWQLERYMRVSGMKKGFLVNFGPKLDVRYYIILDDEFTYTLETQG